MSDQLTPRGRAQLTRLAAKLNRVVSLETVAANRDPNTGTFKSGSSISAKSVRAAWRLVGTRGTRPQVSPRDVFKKQLLAALRTRTTK